MGGWVYGHRTILLNKLSILGIINSVLINNEHHTALCVNGHQSRNHYIRPGKIRIDDMRCLSVTDGVILE